MCVEHKFFQLNWERERNEKEIKTSMPNESEAATHLHLQLEMWICSDALLDFP